MVDGTVTTRQAHGRPVSLQFRRSAARYLHTSTSSEPQCQPPPETEFGQYGEEIVQETISGILEGGRGQEKGI